MIALLTGRDTAGRISRLLRPGAAGSGAVTLLTPAALSVPGWAHDPENPEGDRIVLDGKPRLPGELTAVVTALDAVWPTDLPHVVAADREFAAAEMTAFLNDWLATLACPVIDGPTAAALSGRAADPAAWSAAAAALGLPARLDRPVPPPRHIRVTIAAGRIINQRQNERWFDDAAPAVRVGRQAAAAALALARSCGVTAVQLLFSAGPGEPALLGALPWWYSPDAPTLDAVLARARELADGRDELGTAGLRRALRRPEPVPVRRPPAGPIRGARRPRGTTVPQVLLWGLPEEDTLGRVHQALLDRGTPVVLADQHRALGTRLLHDPDGPLLRLAGSASAVPLGAVTACYPRPYPSRPAITDGDRAHRVARRHVARLEHDLWHWLATTPATVVNAPGPAASNATKSRQTRAARACGFHVPDSLLTNDAAAAAEFARRHGQVIYKGASGTRTRPGWFDPADADRLRTLGTCPVYLQRYIRGDNVRVHVVDGPAGPRLFAAEITSDALDYRADFRAMTAARLPPDVERRCLAVTRSLGLLLAGLDLIRTQNGAWYLLEANPSPAFTFYPRADEVATAIATLLTGWLPRAAGVAESPGRRGQSNITDSGDSPVRIPADDNC